MSESPAVPPSVVHEIVHGLHLAVIERYLSAAGLVAMFYDHALTFSDEVRLIWTAPPSFAKWMFLANRYLTVVCLVAVANEMLGLNSRPYTDETCQKLISIVWVYGVFSTLTNTLLAYFRVVVLWDKSPRVGLVLTVAMMFSALVTFTCTIISIFLLASYVKYNALARMCFLTKTDPSFIGVWTAPLFFEILMLFLVSYNALSRPRGPEKPLVRVLYRDGFLFFFAVTLLRGSSLVFSIISVPGLIAFPVFFSWPMAMLATNRMLIHVRSSEDEYDTYRDADEEDLLREAVVSTTIRASADFIPLSSIDPFSGIELRPSPHRTR